jgi:hypothetical protein
LLYRIEQIIAENLLQPCDSAVAEAVAQYNLGLREAVETMASARPCCRYNTTRAYSAGFMQGWEVALQVGLTAPATGQKG